MSRHPSRSPKINFLRLCYAASKWSSKPFRYLKTSLTSTLSQPERLVEVPRTSIFENPYQIGHGVPPLPPGGGHKSVTVPRLPPFLCWILAHFQKPHEMFLATKIACEFLQNVLISSVKSKNMLRMLKYNQNLKYFQYFASVFCT